MKVDLEKYFDVVYKKITNKGSSIPLLLIAFDNDKFLNQYKNDNNIKKITFTPTHLQSINLYIISCVDSSILINETYLKTLLDNHNISSRLAVVNNLLGYDADDKDEDYLQFEWLAQGQVLNILLNLNYLDAIQTWLGHIPPEKQKHYSNYQTIKNFTEAFVLKKEVSGVTYSKRLIL